MRFTRKAMIAGAVGVALAGAALAADHARSKTMLVAMPDGTVEQIHYTGDVPPNVTFVAQPQAPSDLFEAAFGPHSAFAEMRARSETLLRRAAAMQAQAPAANGQGVTLTNAAGQPIGVMHYSYVSSRTDAQGCTQTVSYSSDGQAPQPKVTRTASDGCSAAVKAGVTATALPAANATPAVIPVSAPKPAPRLTAAPSI